MNLPVVFKKSDLCFGYREPEGDGYKDLSQYTNIIFYITDVVGTKLKYSRVQKDGYKSVIVKSEMLIDVLVSKTDLDTLKAGKLKLTVDIVTPAPEGAPEGTTNVSTVFEDFIAELKLSSAE